MTIFAFFISRQKVAVIEKLFWQLGTRFSGELAFSGGLTVFTYQETYTMTPRLLFNPSQLTQLTTLRHSHVPDRTKNPPNNDA